MNLWQYTAKRARAVKKHLSVDRFVNLLTCQLCIQMCEALIINNLRVKEIEFLIDGSSNCKVATTS